MLDSIHAGVVGDQCGKSHLICKFLFDTYKDGDDPTVGENFVICTVNFDKLSNAIIQPFVEDSYIQNSFTVDNIQYKLEILDTSGNDCYSNLYRKWFSSCDVFICAYSIASNSSFDTLPLFLEEIQKVKNSKFPMILVGLQADQEENRQVTTKEGLSQAYRYKCPYREISSKNDEKTKIDEVFRDAVREYIKFLEVPPEIEIRKSKSVTNKNIKEKEIPLSLWRNSVLKTPVKVGKVTNTKLSKKLIIAVQDGNLYLFSNSKVLYFMKFLRFPIMHNLLMITGIPRT